MRAFCSRSFLILTTIYLCAPLDVWAGGEKASTLVVVADTRRVDSSVWRYFADIYNTSPWLFALWAALLTALFGGFLGFLMDFIMSRTGLDLKSRKIIEH